MQVLKLSDIQSYFVLFYFLYLKQIKYAICNLEKISENYSFRILHP